MFVTFKNETCLKNVCDILKINFKMKKNDVTHKQMFHTFIEL